MPKASRWRYVQAAVLLGSALLAVVLGVVAAQSSGTTRQALTSAAAALMGGAVVGLAGWAQQRAEAVEGRDLKRELVYEQVVDLAQSHNALRYQGAFLFQLSDGAGTGGPDTAATLDALQSVLFEVRRVDLRLDRKLDEARRHAGPELCSRFDEVKEQLARKVNGDFSLPLREVQLDLKPLTEAIEHELGHGRDRGPARDAGVPPGAEGVP